MRKPKILVLGAVLTACFLLIAFSVTAMAAADSASKAFRFRLQGEPTTLDWNLANTPYEIDLLMNLMEGLVHLDANLKAQPALAESWTISPDRRTYTFTLRALAKWSDGKTVTSVHFVDSWRRLLEPLTSAPYAYFLRDIENAEAYSKGTIRDFAQVGIKAVSPSVLQIRLAKPVAQWEKILSFWVTFPIRRDLVDEIGNSWVRPGSMVTAGPFVLSQHDQGAKYVLTANPYYYGGMLKTRRIEAVVVTDTDEAVRRFKAGELDFVGGLGASNANDPSLKGELKAIPWLRTVYLGMNVDRYPVTNIHVRRAIARAIPGREIQRLAGGMEQLPGSFVPPGILGFDAGIGLGSDQARARSEMKTSGLSEKQGRADLLVSDNPTLLKVALTIAQSLRDTLGMTVNVVSLEQSQYALQRSMKSTQLFVSSWIADYPDPDNFLSIFNAQAGNNHTGWKSSSYDRRIRKARDLLDPARRSQEYRVAQAQLQEEAAAIRPLYYDVNRVLTRANVKGLEITPLSHVFFRKVSVE